MRTPDLIIGSREDPQTFRWHLARWLGFQFALHKWLRSDEDRALHDHTGDNVSFILSPQGYDEIVRELCRNQAWCEAWRPVDCLRVDGVWYNDVIVRRRPFVPYFRRAEEPHRVVLRDGRPVWSLWLRWPPRRHWGFHCPSGWRKWEDFCATRDYSTPGSTSEVGSGCG